MLASLLVMTSLAYAALDNDGDGFDADLDCNDADVEVHPGAFELLGDGVDQDCDGHDACYVDADGDGFGTDQTVAAAGAVCGADGDPTADRTGDCDDSLVGPLTRPDAQEVCDGVDNNCNGEVDEVSSPDATVWYLDADGDLWGDVRFQIKACGQPVGYVAQAGDCNDEDKRAYPQNQEVCDGIDNNCVSGIDEDSAIDVFTWYEDSDEDGYGNKDVVVQACANPSTSVWVEGLPLDCDDTDPDVGPCPSETAWCATSTAGTGASGLAALGLFAIWRRRATRAR